MTIQPVETGLDLDLELLVGEMPAVPCESEYHAEWHRDAGPATHYVNSTCPHCGDHEDQRGLCAFIVALIRANGLFQCMNCGRICSGSESCTILGPVNSFG